ncbi:alpha/beta hydrolase [Nocardia goodfellowii]|uniref:S-formylglutathione hydrolase FrmB n=1 Tax=Nocardia goodfellowii TaxID=882446 RepID=A0ABS4QNQ1_9NOCA|nr:alpha/beta hydrolase family protein [Nocardia goodfellowii]MBP2193339.1 S-formylglutathione hydrolase FrmB [Nocardia goodfellowii]
MRRLLRCLVVLIAATAVLFPLPATADPGSGILEVRPLGGRQFAVVVYSAAMGRTIPVWVSHPGGPAPALYLLNAVDGGESGGPWTNRTDAAHFFADKPVNVIQPIGGHASYYTDWLADDPALGRVRWSTFLIDELPPLLESHFGMTGRNAVAGTSMSATSALNLAIEAPGRYQAVGAYSGCPRTHDSMGRAYVYSQLSLWGANPANMWGGMDHPAWAAHDPVLNADKLRGVALYISAGDGTAGKHDTLAAPSIAGDAGRLADRMLVGGGMESFVRNCATALTDRLAELGIPATVAFRHGTHAWPYWEDDLHDSWPVFAAALGV